MAKRVVLGVSGGLDTSVAVRWIRGKRSGAREVVARGGGRRPGAERRRGRLGDHPPARARAGAIEAEVVDVCVEFASQYVFLACEGERLYEGKYPLSPRLPPGIARHLCPAAGV